MIVDPLDCWYIGRNTNNTFNDALDLSRTTLRGVNFISIFRLEDNHYTLVYFFPRIKFHIKLYQL